MQRGSITKNTCNSRIRKIRDAIGKRVSYVVGTRSSFDSAEAMITNCTASLTSVYETLATWTCQ